MSFPLLGSESLLFSKGLERTKADAVSEQDFPEGHPVEGERDAEGIMIAGGSIILNPLGETLAGPLRGGEG